jgi:RNA polymerase sigma factor (sigma-70 family)
MMELMRDQDRSVERIETFYRYHHEKLWRSLLGYTGDPDLASEAESEALSQALRRGDAIDDPAAWIWGTAYRIAGGLLADRRSRANAEAPLGAPRADLEPAALMAGDPLVETIGMLHVLSPQQKAVVVLRYVAGLKPAAIAEVLDTSPGTVRVQLHRAHEILRQTWSDR